MDAPEKQTRAEFLKTFLAERDLPCPMCGYNLRALTSEKCPECGSEVEVTVGLTEPRIAAFISGVVGLAAGMGFNALMLTWLGWMRIVQGQGSPGWRQAWPLVLGLVVTAVGLRLWLRRRKQIRLLEPSNRAMLVAGCYVMSLALAVLFFSLVR